MVLELGLHRRRSLYENYPDAALRALAVRAFWCIYVLDRRWSFGTGLSFALIDRDLDPRLPGPVRTICTADDTSADWPNAASRLTLLLLFGGIWEIVLEGVGCYPSLRLFIRSYDT